MGYDMKWVHTEPQEAATMQELSQRFSELIAQRDALLHGQTVAEQERNDLQSEIEDLMVRMQETEVSYFRLNVWGMRQYRDFMVQYHMLDCSTESPVFPDPEDFDMDRPEYEVFEAQELRGEVTDQRYLRWVRSHNDVLAWTPPNVHGISVWKLCSNDGWIVTPMECLRAITAWVDAGQPNPDSEEPEYWAKWISYLRGAASHGGFRVG